MPFGTPWGGKDAAEGVEQAVNDEYTKGFDGRWGAGLPGSGDMQMLFLQSAIDKMDDNFGRAAIIENGSPLFSGGTASGESQVRRWMLENDLIEAIIALPTDLFYNTGIATYIWVLSKNKRRERKGKIQLIDASGFYGKLRKALGNKKNEISSENRTQITKLYADFAENEYCKIYRNEEFIYREYTVMQPLQRSYAITEDRIEAMLSKGSLSSLYDQAKVDELENMEELSGKDLKKLEAYQNNQPLYEAIIAALQAAISEQVYDSPKAFMPVLTKVLANATADKKLLDKIADGLSVMDKDAEIQKDKKGNILFDKETKDTELVKWEESIDDYMAREVLPHVPDAKAFFEEDLGKKKPVIKTGAEIPFTRYECKGSPYYINQTTGIQNINLSLMLAKEKAYYPDLVLQEKIIEFLDAKCAEIDALTADIQTQIDTLEQYKRSIITEAVTRGLNPDVEMKDSGTPWCPLIPIHWKYANPKALFTQRLDRAYPGDKQLTASQEYGVIYQDEYMELTGTKIVTVMKDFSILKHVEPNDFVISMRSFQGGLEYSERRGSISSAYVMLIPNNEYVYPPFYRCFFKSSKYINAIQSTSNLVRDGQAMRYANFAQVPLFIIPLDEQKQISEYLDEKVRKIDEILKSKNNQLEILAEYKKSLIYEYVTGKKEVPAI